MKIRPVVAELFHTDGQTGRHEANCKVKGKVHPRTGTEALYRS